MNLFKMIYLRVILISFLLINCRGKSQTVDENVVSKYILEKKINGGFDFNENVHIDFVNDSTSIIGIFDKISIKSQEEKKIIFADTKQLEKTPARYNEGKSEGWVYQLKFPSTISLYSLNGSEIKYEEAILLKSSDDYDSLVNSFIKSNEINSKFLGNFIYEKVIETNKEKIGGKSIFYELKIKKDSSLFIGQGYQTNFYDLCNSKEQNDTLKIYYKKSIEGTDYNKNEKSYLIKLYQKKQKYYGVSPLINEGQEVLFERE